MILPIAFAVLASQANTLTLTIPPTPVAKVVEMIAKASGRKLAVAPALLDEVVLARLKDAPVDSTLRRLSESLVARWTTRNDGTTWLEPDPKQLRHIRTEQLKQEIAKYSAAQRMLLEELAKQPTDWDQRRTNKYHEEQEKGRAEWRQRFKDPDSVLMMEGPESPIWRGIVKIVSTLDPKELAAMPEDAREVWAEEPTPVQHAFSLEAQSAIRNLRKELDLVEPDLTCKRVKLQVKKWGAASVDTMLFAYSSTGKVIEATDAWLDPNMLQRLQGVTQEPSSPSARPSPTLTPPKDCLEIRNALATTYRGKDRSSLFAKWRDRFEDPVKYEPLQWHHGLDLILAAEANGQQLIGTINDFTSSRYWELAPKTADQALAQDVDVEIKSEPGWIVIRGNVNQERSSRFKARDLIRQSLRIGGVTVDMAAEWQVHSTFPRPFLSWVGDYLSEIHSDMGEFSSLAGLLNYRNLELWAKLGNSTRDALRRGETIEIRNLPDPARQQVAKLVYWHYQLDDPKVEPTDVWPNGSVDGILKLTVRETPIFIGWSSAEGPSVDKRPLDASTFERLLAEGDQIRRPIPPVVFRQYDRFRIGVCRSYTLHVTLEPGSVPMNLVYSETLFPPENKTLEALPSELAHVVEKARQYAVDNPTKKAAPPIIHP